jgi:hypothetical protein
MAMSVAVLEILEEAQFPPAQARALTRVLEIEAASHREELATKSDLLATRADIARLQEITKADLAHLRESTRADLDRLEKVIKAELQHLASHKDIEQAKAEGMRFTLLAILSQFTLIAGAMYYLLQNAR